MSQAWRVKKANQSGLLQGDFHVFFPFFLSGPDASVLIDTDLHDPESSLDGVR